MEHPERKDPCDKFGIHRVLDVKKSLPQAANRLDNSLPIYSNEALIRVEKLNIDAASFLQMEEESRGDETKIAKTIFDNSQTKGKQENAVTHSGGMLIGTVEQLGSTYSGPLKKQNNKRIASLVSLTATPLRLEKVIQVQRKTHQVDVEGHAILFPTSAAVPLPEDLPEPVAMAILDVAGAPASVHRWCRPGQRLIIIGAGGKAGLLCCAAGQKRVTRRGQVIGVETNPEARKHLERLNLCHAVLDADATDPLVVRSGVEKVTRGKMGDVVINVASVPGTEMATILAACPAGRVIFFSMATAFSRAALGAESIGSTATMFIGNGYLQNHAEIALNLVRKNRKLREHFLRKYEEKAL